MVPIRFYTRFSLGLAPAHSPPEPDGSETVDAGWFGPQDALDMHQAGELPLVFPTIKPLESLVGFANATEALEAARRRVVKPVEPRVEGEGDEQRIVLPTERPQAGPRRVGGAGSPLRCMAPPRILPPSAPRSMPMIAVNTTRIGAKPG